MMHEEFTRLSKVETTLKYYEETIEPLYMEAGLEKEAFVEQWLKNNKANIVKAHVFDIDRASTALALQTCKAAELEKVKTAKEETEQKLRAANETIQALTEQNNDYYNRKVEAEERAKEYSKFKPELEAAKEALAAKEAEIQKLKAMLFDALYSGNAA